MELNQKEEDHTQQRYKKKDNGLDRPGPRGETAESAGPPRNPGKKKSERKR